MNTLNRLQRRKTQHQIDLRLHHQLTERIQRLHPLQIQSQCLILLQHLLKDRPTQEVISILIEHILSNIRLACGMSITHHRYLEVFLQLLVFQLFALSMLLHNDMQRLPCLLVFWQQLRLLSLPNFQFQFALKGHQPTSQLHLSWLLSLDLVEELLESTFS